MKQLKQVGMNLKSARRSARLRQTDLATKSGVAYRHYQDIEAGKINLTLDTLFRLAKALDVHPAALLAFADSDEPA